MCTKLPEIAVVYMKVYVEIERKSSDGFKWNSMH